MVADLLAERRSMAAGEPTVRPTLGGLPPRVTPGAAGCCPNRRGCAPGAVRGRRVSGLRGTDLPEGLGLQHELLDVAWKAARRAGELLRVARHDELQVATKTSRTDVVTQMDTASERLIVEEILAARPDDGLLAEEGSERASVSGVRWIIDPLDGTVNYLYGLPTWAVSIAGEVDGSTAVGVVDIPVLHETFVAVRGQGARWVTDATIRTPSRTPRPAWLSVSWPRASGTRWAARGPVPRPHRGAAQGA